MKQNIIDNDVECLVALINRDKNKKKKFIDVKEGNRFIYNRRMYQVVDFIKNPKAGEPMRDMWGGIVYRESYGTFLSVDVETLKPFRMTMQNEDSEVPDCYLFI